MSCDTKFRTLAANYPSLRWDVRHPDLWLECITIPKPVTPECWPCPHCNSIYHFPNRCPFRDDKTSVPNDTRPFSLALPTNPQQLSQLSADNQIHLHSCVGTSTTVEGAPKTAATSATFVNAVEGPIQNSSAPTLQGSPLSLERRGLCTTLRPFILEWELSSHPDKVFVELLLSDIRQGCDIGYTGP